MVKSYLLFLRYALKNWLSKEKLVDESSAFDVSLTSHGDRVNRVHLAIESACSGIKPRRVILFLSREDWPGRLPKSLTRLCHRGLEVITCENDGPHKKLQPYLQMTASFVRPLITIDDDVFYEHLAFKHLFDAWLSDKAVIHCLRARSVLTNGDALMPYIAWPLCNSSAPSHLNFSTGVGGVLYPPDFLLLLKRVGLGYRATCPDADDIWVNACAVRSGFRVRQVLNVPSRRPDIPGSRGTALFKKNIRLGGNDAQLARVYDKYIISIMTDDFSRRFNIDEMLSN